METHLFEECEDTNNDILRSVLLEKKMMRNDLYESLLTLRVLTCSQYHYLPSFSGYKVLYNILR